MKTLGLIGLQIWESALAFCRLVSEQARRPFSAPGSAHCLKYPFGFELKPHRGNELPPDAVVDHRHGGTDD